ncbi:MAG: HlyD family secretion protein [Gaiellaceae bacterium]|jgi:RND family efflux transporter MFP subunit|nr:HlyD family secretion protein [Gaiellaceae bacterium]
MTELISFRRGLLTLALLGLGVATALAVWPLEGGGGGSTTAPTATAARGDVVLTVGGVGRIVSARAANTPATPAAQGSTAASTSAAAPAGAVFASASGRIARYLVAPGERISAGQPLAVLDDAGAAAVALDQARSELEAARLELQQKETADPARGLPPSAAELTAARVAAAAAARKLGLVVRPPKTEVIAAQLELRKAEADLAVLRRVSTPVALAAAERAVGVAYQKLAQASGPAPAADVLAAQQELARAQADLEALQTGPSATAREAAQLAVTLAQQKLVELPSGALPSEVTQAKLELAKAQADLEALQRAPTATAVAAARTAVDLAVSKLANAKSPLAVASARAELDTARSELQTARLGADAVSVNAARLAVTLARQKLALVRRPAPIVRDAARVELTKALADLDALRRRGGPAGAIDLALARVKVRSAEARVSAGQGQAGRLTVAAPLAGTVTALLSVTGSPVDPATPVAVVADLDHLAVDVDLSEFDVARVRSGQAAVVSVDALGGRRYPGTVVFEALSGVENGGLVTFPVRIRLPRVAGVKPGMNVSVRIIVARRRSVVHVPLEAVSQDGEVATVTLAGAGGARSIRTVRLGLADNKIVEIRSGLEAGERVLLQVGGQ